jgi:hypothetical protein
MMRPEVGWHGMKRKEAIDHARDRAGQNQTG